MQVHLFANEPKVGLQNAVSALIYVSPFLL